MRKIIFMATTKPYDDYNKNIQINAISSWLSLNTDKRVIINSSDTDNSRYLSHKDLKIAPLKRQSPTGVPYVKDIFESGYDDYVKGDILCFINADMILQDDFVYTLNSLPLETYTNFLLGGRRWSWKNEKEFLKPLSFPLNTDEIKKQGDLDPSCATDYFVHNKELYENVIPDDMLIARHNYDMWLNSTAIFRRQATTIDITNTCLAIHPNHRYGEKKEAWELWIKTVMSEVIINRKYESSDGKIDTYGNFTVMENNNIVVKKRR